MFKKSKPRTLNPPAVPNLEEILADIETFHSDALATRSSVSSGGGELNSWWEKFERYEADFKQLSVVSSEINSYKAKLKQAQSEIEEETKLIKQKINEQQKLIKEIQE